jgi:hypothetical protein
MVGLRNIQLSKMTAAFVLMAGYFLLPTQTALAAPGIVVSGRVVNTTTGAPVTGATMVTCTANSPVTDANGHWQMLVATGTGYCVRVGAGLPVGVVNPSATSNNPDVGQYGSYEFQQAGVNCYHVATCSAELQKWDRSYDGNLDISVKNAVVAPVGPIPQPATPAPATPTVVPTVTPTPEATASPTSVTTDTPVPLPTSMPVAPKASFASQDGVATVEVSESAFPAGALCSVEKSDVQKVPQDVTAITSIYNLKCVTTSGKDIELSESDVAWHLHLKSRLEKLGNPQAVAYSGGTAKVIESTYDNQTQILSFNAPIDIGVYAVASPPSKWWISALVVAGVIMLFGAAVLYFPLRGHRRRSYQEYLRAKYYNL